MRQLGGSHPPLIAELAIERACREQDNPPTFYEDPEAQSRAHAGFATSQYIERACREQDNPPTFCEDVEAQSRTHAGFATPQYIERACREQDNPPTFYKDPEAQSRTHAGFATPQYIERACREQDNPPTFYEDPEAQSRTHAGFATPQYTDTGSKHEEGPFYHREVPQTAMGARSQAALNYESNYCTWASHVPAGTSDEEPLPVDGRSDVADRPVSLHDVPGCMAQNVYSHPRHGAAMASHSEWELYTPDVFQPGVLSLLFYPGMGLLQQKKKSLCICLVHVRLACIGGHAASERNWGRQTVAREPCFTHQVAVQHCRLGAIASRCFALATCHTHEYVASGVPSASEWRQGHGRMAWALARSTKRQHSWQPWLCWW